MSKSLCALWRRFLEGGDDGVVFRDELLDHVEDCRECQARVQRVADPAMLWRRLAGEVGEDEARARSHLAERYDRQHAIETAVVHQLLPSLSAAVQDAWGSLDPLAVFRGLDAVALLIRAFPDPDEEPPKIVLRHAAEVWVDQACAIPRSTIEAEVARSTSTSADGRGASGRGVMPATAVASFVDWIPQAARDNESLFLGIRCEPLAARDAALTIVERDNAAELDMHWLAGSARSRGERWALGTHPEVTSDRLLAPSAGAAMALDFARPRSRSGSTPPTHRTANPAEDGHRTPTGGRAASERDDD